MHVDLEIPAAADAVSLRSAMASDASFPVVVADFLETWRQPDSPIESLEGLAFIATQIRSLVIKNMGTWRFSVVPRASLAEPALLEVRLIIDLSAVLVKQPHPALTINGLKSPEPAVFFEALRTLMNELQTPANSAQYPGAVAFLGHVYVPASP